MRYSIKVDQIVMQFRLESVQNVLMLEEWDAEIDDRVANLYGLTAEEMKTIRGD
jgi:hypothetical protein